jgi:D-sedoheptulose 7-phosphate isomerase
LKSASELKALTPQVAADPGLKAFVRAYREESISALDKISDQAVATLIQVLHDARVAQRQIFICGNGGSATTASHLAAGLGNEGSRGRREKFRVRSLTDNVPWITSLANDSEYAAIFVEQLKNFAEPDDVLIAFSGSGNSPNVIRAIEWANEAGLLTVGITGRPGGKLASLSRQSIFVESTHIGRVEEGHFLIQHLVTYYFVEAR